jgi:hypothetical protein
MGYVLSENVMFTVTEALLTVTLPLDGVAM